MPHDLYDPSASVPARILTEDRKPFAPANVVTLRDGTRYVHTEAMPTTEDAVYILEYAGQDLRVRFRSADTKSPYMFDEV